MHFEHVQTSPDAGVAIREQLSRLFTDPPVLEPDADTTTRLAAPGGVPGMWVTAPPHTRARSLADSGVVLYVHGGGFEYKNPPLEQIMAYRLSAATRRPAFAVDYRLAPDHPFPAAVEDVVAAYRGLLRAGVPTDRILLAGESAGGTLVLSSLLYLEPGEPRPGGAVAVSPVTDFAATDAPDAGADVIAPSAMGHIDDQYLAGARPDEAPQSPIYGNLAALPPVLLVAGNDEVLLDHSTRFATTATEQGANVTLHVYEQMPHAFHAGILFPTDEHLPPATEFLDRLRRWVLHTAEQ